MIFLTTGTLFPFDRLVKAVDDGVGRGMIREAVFAQIGNSSYKPQHVEFTDKLSKEEYDRKVADSVALISHAGIGSITSALSRNKPLLVMPRLKRFGEHVNDHQVGTAKKFEELGHVLVAWDEKQLPGKIEELRSFVPRPRQAQPEVVAAHIREFINSFVDQR